MQGQLQASGQTASIVQESAKMGGEVDLCKWELDFKSSPYR